MRVTGITGEVDDAEADELSGRFGRGDRTFELSCVVFGLGLALPGVEGYDDRMRGVPFMACSPRSLGTLCTRGSAGGGRQSIIRSVVLEFGAGWARW